MVFGRGFKQIPAVCSQQKTLPEAPLAMVARGYSKPEVLEGSTIQTSELVVVAVVVVVVVLKPLGSENIIFRIFRPKRLKRVGIRN